MLSAALKRGKSLARRMLRPPLHTAEVTVPHTVYGTEYGGWPLVDGTVGSDTVVVSVGLGEDVSFDRAIIERFGCQVHGCDPTPKSLEWLAAQELPANLHVHPLGLGARDGTAVFIPPADAAHVSFSAVRGAGQTGEGVEIDICSLPTLLARIGVDRVDVLKMDIEGFEYEVIAALSATSIRPGQILVEFHHRMYTYGASDTETAVNQLRALGYRIFHVSPSGHEYGLVLSAGA